MTHTSQRPNARQIAGYALLAACFLAPLGLHALLASYSRYAADDFGPAADLVTYGFWGSISHVYLTWSGRFSANFLDSVVSSWGPQRAAWFAPLALAAWGLALAATLYQFLPGIRRYWRIYTAGLLAAMVLFTSLETIPFVRQSLYWGQGMRAVIPPLILGTSFAGLGSYWVRRDWHGRRARLWWAGAALAAGLTWLAGGFHEGYVAMQTTALILALLISGWIGDPAGRRRLRVWCLAGLAGSLLAMLATVLAPGNQFRQAYYPEPDLLRIAWVAPLSLAKALGRALRDRPGNLYLAGMLAFAIFLGSGKFLPIPARKTQPPPESTPPSRESGPVFPADVSEAALKRALLIIPPLTLIILLAFFVPPAYGMSGPPPGRSRIIPLYVCSLALTAWGGCLGQLAVRTGRWQVIRSRWLPAALWAITIAFAVGALATAVQLWHSRPAFIEYIHQWEARDAVIRQAAARGESWIDLPPIQNPLGVLDLTPEADLWVNQNMSAYYGITVISSDYQSP